MFDIKTVYQESINYCAYQSKTHLSFFNEQISAVKSIENKLESEIPAYE